MLCEFSCGPVFSYEVQFALMVSVMIKSLISTDCRGKVLSLRIHCVAEKLFW